MLAVCRRFGNRRLHYAGLRFVSQQEHMSLTALASSPSVHFCLILFSVKIITQTFQHSFQKKWQMLVLCSRNTSLILNCLRIQRKTKQSAIQKLTLWQGEVARKEKRSSRLQVHCIIFNFCCCF